VFDDLIRDQALLVNLVCANDAKAIAEHLTDKVPEHLLVPSLILGSCSEGRNYEAGFIWSFFRLFRGTGGYL